jgi:uncharacterized Zn finger protein
VLGYPDRRNLIHPRAQILKFQKRKNRKAATKQIKTIWSWLIEFPLTMKISVQQRAKMMN